jgi:hypothetical protein
MESVKNWIDYVRSNLAERKTRIIFVMEMIRVLASGSFTIKPTLSFLIKKRLGEDILITGRGGP